MHHYIEIRDLDTIPYFYDWSQVIFIVRVPIDSSTHYLGFYGWIALPKSFPNACVPSSEAVFTIYIIVFDVRDPTGYEPTTYCMRDGHTNHCCIL